MSKCRAYPFAAGLQIGGDRGVVPKLLVQSRNPVIDLDDIRLQHVEAGDRVGVEPGLADFLSLVDPFLCRVVGSILGRLDVLASDEVARAEVDSLGLHVKVALVGDPLTDLVDAVAINVKDVFHVDLISFSDVAWYVTIGSIRRPGRGGCRGSGRRGRSGSGCARRSWRRMRSEWVATCW